MKVKSKNFKLLQIILRITYRGLGAIGGTFIITDYKWTGLIILTLAAMCNEAITIIKEEEDEEIISIVPSSNSMQSNQEIGDGC